MSNRDDSAFLDDIKEAARRIAVYTDDLDYEAFLNDFRTQDAVVRNLEIIGEATKNISEELKGRYSLIPWKGLAGVRDKLIHHYFGVNFDIVWNIINDELPQIIVQLEEIPNN